MQLPTQARLLSAASTACVFLRSVIRIQMHPDAFPNAAVRLNAACRLLIMCNSVLQKTNPTALHFLSGEYLLDMDLSHLLLPAH